MLREPHQVTPAVFDPGVHSQLAALLKTREKPPVIDLFTKDNMRTQKFDVLARHNPGVQHIYVGHYLDGSYHCQEGYRGGEWNPDEQALKMAPGLAGLPDPVGLRQRDRLWSSRDVNEFLAGLKDNSVNRINIDMGLVNSGYMQKCFAQCMRVLEPGGAVEFASMEYDRTAFTEIMRKLGLKYMEVEPTPLDFQSSMLSAHHSQSYEQPEQKAIKFIIEKPGGGTGVDRRTFWQRLPPKEQENLSYRV